MSDTPKTFVGATSSYATPSDFINMADQRLLGDLVRDDGSEATPTQLLTDANLSTALLRASGIVEAYTLKGERYTVADLQAFPNGSPAQAMLKGIVCGLAIQYVRRRRGYDEPDYPLYKDALELLNLLADGASIFPFSEVQQAGVAQTRQRFPSSFYTDTPDLITNNVRSFGLRANRRGGFPGGAGSGSGWGNSGAGF